MSQKYVVVHFLDTSKVPDEFPSTEWPLHITLLANFTLAKPLSQLKQELLTYAEQADPIEVTADGQALFGPKQNVNVSLIRPTPGIRAIHDNLSSIASNLGAVFDEPAFMGEGYRPHATVQVDSRLSDKQTVRIDNLTLVDMFPNDDITRRGIIETYELGIV